MKEADIMRACMIEASKHGAVLFRNNLGSYQHKDGYYIKYGVCNPGGSDLIGWSKEGLFVALEIKTPTGRAKPEQLNFINQVKKAGGIAGICTCPEDVINLLTSK